MKNVPALAVVLVAAVGVAQAIQLGDQAPAVDVKMKDVSGRMVSIADVRGEKGTMVMFSCNACPWVKAWETRIAELGNRAPEMGIGVIVINPNDPAKVAEDSYEVMQERARERGFQFPYVVDDTSGVAKAFGATRTPEVFLFDAAGKLVYHGAIDDNAREPEKVEKHYLADAMQAVAAGKPVPVAETKAIGCTIKWR